MAAFTTVRSSATVQSGRSFKLANCEFQLVLTQSGQIIGRLYSASVVIPVGPNSKRTILSTSYDGRTIYFTSTLEDYQELATICRKSNRLEFRIATHRHFATLEAQVESLQVAVTQEPQAIASPWDTNELFGQSTEIACPVSFPAQLLLPPVAEAPATKRPSRRQLLALAKEVKLPKYSRMSTDELFNALYPSVA